MEVSKLSLPTDQGARIADGEPQFKPQHGILTERAIADCVLGLLRRDVL